MHRLVTVETRSQYSTHETLQTPRVIMGGSEVRLEICYREISSMDNALYWVHGVKRYRCLRKYYSIGTHIR